MTLSVDLFFSFRSPYSYLALPKTLKLVADYDVTVNLRPVYPLAVRVPGFSSAPIRDLRATSCSIPAALPNTRTSRSAFPAPIRLCRT
jgi:2-hydroxychromene-2-carboxylate isomerase